MCKSLNVCVIFKQCSSTWKQEDCSCAGCCCLVPVFNNTVQKLVMRALQEWMFLAWGMIQYATKGTSATVQLWHLCIWAALFWVNSLYREKRQSEVCCQRMLIVCLCTFITSSLAASTDVGLFEECLRTTFDNTGDLRCLRLRYFFITALQHVVLFFGLYLFESHSLWFTTGL